MAEVTLNTAAEAVAYVLAGVRENKRLNGAPIGSWKSPADAVDAYVDGDYATLSKKVNRARVIADVGNKLAAEKAFEAALASGPAFIAWVGDRDISREELNRVIAETTHNDVAESAADVDYVAALGNGDFLMWGAEYGNGRDLIVGVQGKDATSNLAVIFVPKWTADA